MLATMDSFETLCADRNPPVAVAPASGRALQWRTRYDGLVTVAYIGSKAVAGISGPWSGKYALTWWDRPMPTRELELHDSLGSAQREVEEWALRTGGDYILPLPAHTAHGNARGADSHAARKSSGLFDRLRSLLPLQPSTSEKIERLRRERVQGDADLGDLRFAANE
ncbi:hypothetical protein [Dokdonella sp.]|uniref:hypothetical protein n=1 Tax=Dokdonella sp. TaxID=2291710 RepID=UPI002F42F131